MMRLRQIMYVAGILAAAAVALAIPAWAAPESHSGTILALNKEAGTIVLAEVGLRA